MSLILCSKCKTYDGWKERTSRRTGRKLKSVRVCSEAHEPPKYRCDVCAVEVLLVQPRYPRNYWHEPLDDWHLHKLSATREVRACPGCYAEILKATEVAFDAVCDRLGQSRAGQLLGVEPREAR